MRTTRKFQGFARWLKTMNGTAEAREKYDDESVDRSHAKLLGMSMQQYAEYEKLTAELNETLKRHTSKAIRQANWRKG